MALHAGGAGRITLARKHRTGWSETSLAAGDLAYAVRHLEGVPDVYITQNRFWVRRRLVSRLAELDALFVDLDHYRSAHAEAHPRHMHELAEAELMRARIPPPGFVVATGRGLALVWLHHPVPRAALPRWRACQRVLVDTLRHLGADPAATDAARVLRLAGTRNSRNGLAVEAITPVGQVWDFELLADEILPDTRAGIAARRLERAVRRAAGQLRLPPGRYFTQAGLWELRLTELQKLLDHRWCGRLPEGQRDTWLLAAATGISYLVPPVVVRREILALADQVTDGRWSQGETASRMSAVIARAGQVARGHRIEHGGRLVDPRYRFRTDTLVEMLAITEDEMRACGLRHLVTPAIRREHERQRWHERRAAAGGLSRADYLERSLARQRPWNVDNISRRTWERRRAREGAVASASGCMVAKPDPDQPGEAS